jgi:hypothetical protein
MSRNSRGSSFFGVKPLWVDTVFVLEPREFDVIPAKGKIKIRIFYSVGNKMCHVFEAVF